MARVVVTGGAGAIGVHLVAELLDRGHETVVVDDLSSGGPGAVPDDAQLVVGSITDDAVLDEAFATRPTLVFHLAALFANQNSVDHPQRDLEVGGVGTLKLLERAAGAGARRLVYTSSSCVYGNRPDPDGRTAAPSADTPYAITKFLGEQYCRFWSDYHGLDTAILRLFNVYGPHDPPGPYRSVIPNFLEAALAGRPLVVTGTGDETREFTYASDAVAAIVAAGETGPSTSAQVFDVASGVPTSVRALAELINDLTGNTAGVTVGSRRRWDGVVHRRADIAHAVARLGFRPSVSLEDGLARTLSWFRSARTAPRHTSPAANRRANDSVVRDGLAAPVRGNVAGPAA